MKTTGDDMRFEATLQRVETGEPRRPIRGSQFIVDETPHAFWDDDLEAKNHAFLRGIDPGYFTHIAAVHAPYVESDDREERQRAAAAIRLAHSQALETFCALLATAVQAPSFALGWMLRYENRDLQAVIGKLHRGERVYSMLPGDTTWESLSTAVHRFQLGDAARERELTQGFARLWSRFAAQFLNWGRTQEYNSLKHGMRARLGGFKLSFGTERVPGEPPPPGAMTPPSGSLFGSAFFTAERVVPKQRDWALTERFRNWEPDDLRAGVELLAISISNVVTFLRGTSGDTSETPVLRYPDNTEDFDAPWSARLAFETMDAHPTVGPEHVKPWKAEDVRAAYPTRP
jgi:hypothetical protein